MRGVKRPIAGLHREKKTRSHQKSTPRRPPPTSHAGDSSLLPFTELKQAKAHERPPAAARLARFLPRKLRDKLAAAKGGGGSGAEADGGAAAGGLYARAPAGYTSDPDKRE